MIPFDIPDSCIVDYRELTDEDIENKVGFYIHKTTGRYYHCLFTEDSTTELVPTQTNKEFEALK